MATQQFRVEIEGSDLSFDVRKGESVLRAAARHKIAFPSLCNVGECGSCRCRLERGQVKLKSDVSRHITDSQLAQGDILACQSTLLSSVTLHVPTLSPHRNEDEEAEKVAATIVAQQLLTENVVQLTVELQRPVSYCAGQFALLFVEGHPILAQNPRSYSMARGYDSEGTRSLEFHIRHIPGGVFTDWLFAEERCGQSLLIQAPFGSMAMQETAQNLLFVAAGSGYAPIHALLETTAHDPKCSATVVYAARSQAEVYPKAFIARLSREYRGELYMLPVLSQEPKESSWQGRRGYVQDHLETLVADISPDTAYLCGSPPLVDASVSILSEHLPVEKIHYDKFLNRSHMVAQQATAESSDDEILNSGGA